LEKAINKYQSKARIYTILTEILNYTKNINPFKTDAQKQITKKTNFKNTNLIKNKKVNYNKQKQLDTIPKNNNLNTTKINTNKTTSYDNPKFDVEKVKKAWLSWHNQVRKQMGLKPYSYSLILEKSAKAWSETMANKNEVNHKRQPSDSYYDY
jgi:uncharacterized protein YkwD